MSALANNPTEIDTTLMIIENRHIDCFKTTLNTEFYPSFDVTDLDILENSASRSFNRKKTNLGHNSVNCGQ